MDFEVTTQPKDETDKRLLLEEVNTSPFIGHIGIRELEKHIERRSILFYYDGETVAAFSAWIPFQQAWSELGPFFTREIYRGAGLGKRTVVDAIEANKALSRNLYGVTKNDVMKHIFEKNGLVRTDFTKLPAPVLVYLGLKANPYRLLIGLQKMRANEKVAHFIQLHNNSSIASVVTSNK